MEREEVGNTEEFNIKTDRETETKSNTTSREGRR